jgi:large subunit ribosomal protein L30
MGKISVTLKKSIIGRPQDQRRTVAGLGLRRIRQTVEHEDNGPIRGMVDKVRHLIEVVAVPAEAAKGRTKEQGRGDA